MTRRQRHGLVYLREAAEILHVTWVMFERALYHPTVRRHLVPRYRKRWGHPRRVRVLTEEDLEYLAEYLLQHGRQFAILRTRHRPVKSTR